MNYRSATAVICLCNLIVLFFIICSHFSDYSFSSSSSISDWRLRTESELIRRSAYHAQDMLRRRKESIEARKAMEPVELIKRVKEIQEESNNYEHDRLQYSRIKYATLLNERLKKLRQENVLQSEKAIREWHKKKTEFKKKIH